MVYRSRQWVILVRPGVMRHPAFMRSILAAESQNWARSITLFGRPRLKSVHGFRPPLKSSDSRQRARISSGFSHYLRRISKGIYPLVIALQWVRLRCPDMGRPLSIHATATAKVYKGAANDLPPSRVVGYFACRLELRTEPVILLMATYYCSAPATTRLRRAENQRKRRRARRSRIDQT